MNYPHKHINEIAEAIHAGDLADVLTDLKHAFRTNTSMRMLKPFGLGRSLVYTGAVQEISTLKSSLGDFSRGVHQGMSSGNIIWGFHHGSSSAEFIRRGWEEEKMEEGKDTQD